MNGELVADIVPGADDATGAKILTVYAKVKEIYAVYRTCERVSIQFADSPTLGAEQRKTLAKLNPLRGQINGLIDGWRAVEDEDYEAPGRLFFWRSQGGHEIKAKAAMFDRRVADALIMGLQGDVDHAEALLIEIKADLIEERTSAARIDYVAIAALAAALLVLIACIFTRYSKFIYDFSPAGMILWLACAAGALGALFSTALAMRTRSILTDLQLRENRTDAILRIGIGALAGVLLVGMLMSKIVTFGLGGGDITLSCEVISCGGEDRGWVICAFIAFVAGFSERLVPDLIDKATAAAARQGGNPLAGSTPPPATAKGGGNASETNPTGREPNAPERSAKDAKSAEPADVEENHVDGCIEDVGLDEAEATQDVELPEARGGVEQPVSPQY